MAEGKLCLLQVAANKVSRVPHVSSKSLRGQALVCKHLLFNLSYNKLLVRENKN